ncbi:MAG TPA: hypothetical protein VEK38_02400 [Candidatus Bathyarchaeia archaeon]|nr:hypothetical protein [Candidatus Bathyarchaeia archaeon]
MKKSLPLFLLVSCVFGVRTDFSIFPDKISETERVAAGCLYFATQHYDQEKAALAKILESLVRDNCNEELWGIATTGTTGFFTGDSCRNLLRLIARKSGYNRYALEAAEREAYSRQGYSGRRDWSSAIYDAASSQSAYPGASSSSSSQTSRSGNKSAEEYASRSEYGAAAGSSQNSGSSSSSGGNKSAEEYASRSEYGAASSTK